MLQPNRVTVDLSGLVIPGPLVQPDALHKALGTILQQMSNDPRV